MRRKLTAETARWLSVFQENIRVLASNVGDRVLEYAVPMDFKFSLEKNPQNADIVLGTGGGQLTGMIIAVAKDIDKTHPKYESGIVDMVNRLLKDRGIFINGYDVRTVREIRKIPDKGDFVWESEIEGGRPRYNESFGNWLAEQAMMQPDFFQRARTKKRQLRAQKRSSVSR